MSESNKKEKQRLALAAILNKYPKSAQEAFMLILKDEQDNAGTSKSSRNKSVVDIIKKEAARK